MYREQIAPGIVWEQDGDRFDVIVDGVRHRLIGVDELPDPRPNLEAIAARQVSDALAVAAAGADRARAGGA